MDKNLLSTLPEFPVKLNLFDFTTIKPFSSTLEGEKTLRFFKYKKVFGYIASGIVWILLAVAVFFVFTSGHYIYGIIIAFFGSFFAFTICKPIIKISKDCIKLLDKTFAHHQTIVEELVDMYFKNTAYFSFNSETLIYNNNLCAYLSTERNELVIYKKQNIKEVIRERVRLGSTTTTYATGTLRADPFTTRNFTSSAQYSTNVKELYEWHFYILTDFLPYPKISMVLPDTKFVEDEVAKAYAVLKP